MVHITGAWEVEMSVGSSSSRRQWFGWTVRIVVAVAMLTFVAHALHQTVGQMIGGAISSASRALDPDNGLISRIIGDRTGPDITITPTSGPLPAHIIVTGTGVTTTWRNAPTTPNDVEFRQPPSSRRQV